MATNSMANSLAACHANRKARQHQSKASALVQLCAAVNVKPLRERCAQLTTSAGGPADCDSIVKLLGRKAIGEQEYPLAVTSVVGNISEDGGQQFAGHVLCGVCHEWQPLGLAAGHLDRCLAVWNACKLRARACPLCGLLRPLTRGRWCDPCVAAFTRKSEIGQRLLIRRTFRETENKKKLMMEADKMMMGKNSDESGGKKVAPNPTCSEANLTL